MSDTVERAVAPVEGVPVESQRSINGDYERSAEQEVLQRLWEDVNEIVSNNPERLNIQMVNDLEGRQQVPKRTSDVFESFVHHRWIDPGEMHFLVAALYRTDHLTLLSKHRIIHPAYRTYQDYYRNATTPAGVIPARTGLSELTRSWSFLGRDLDFPLGVGASSLTCNSAWVQHWFRCGYSVVTYKTVRTRERRPYTEPNWSFVSNLSYEDIKSLEAVIHTDGTLVPSADTVGTISSVNSFGVPSSACEDWSEDLAAACAAAGEGQMLICSVIADNEENKSDASLLIDNFVDVSSRAVEAGAEYIELNLSCPNSMGEGGQIAPPLCIANPSLCAEIIAAVKQAIPDAASLGVKLYYMSRDDLWPFLDSCVEHLDFISGINSVQRSVLNATEGGQFFPGPGREKAAVAGSAILRFAEEFIESLATYRVVRSTRFEIIATGGVTNPSSFKRLYTAGADVVQSVTGVFANSLLASDCIKEFGDKLPYRPPIRSDEAWAHMREVVLNVTPKDEAVPLWRYVSELDAPVDEVLELLEELVSNDKLSKLVEDNIQKYVRTKASVG